MSRVIKMPTTVQKFLSSHLYVLLLIPLVMIIYPLTRPGISITGDFPYLDTPDYAIKRLSMWIETGSIDGFEFLPRFPILGLWHLLGFVGISSAIATKVMIVLGFLLSTLSFYFSFLLYFKDRVSPLDIKLKLSAILGSLFYAYNVWSFNRIHHWYLWLGYALFPIFFVSVLYSLRNPRNWKSILSSIFCWSLASTTPHMAAFYGIVLIIISAAIALNSVFKHENKKQIFQIAIPLLSIVFIYFLVNMYWIYPYFLGAKTGSITPNYEFTEENINLLSRFSNLINSLRVMAYWINLEVVNGYHDSSLFNLWLYASFAIPIVAFSTLVIKKSIKYSIMFSSIALISIYFAMGTRSPLNYYHVMLATPFINNFVWLFRDPDKMSFFIAFAFSFLLGIFSLKILSIRIKDNKVDKVKFILAGSFFILMILTIFFSSYPFYVARMDTIEPVVLPKEFDGLNAYLSSINPDRIYIIPYPMEETQWDQKGRVATIYQTHSIKPSIESTEYNFAASNYYNFLVRYIMENRSRDITNLIYPLGTSYLIFHNDTWSKNINNYNPGNIELLEKISNLQNIKNVKNIGFYKVFNVLANGSNKAVHQLNIPSQNIMVLGGMEAYPSLNTLSSFDSLKSSVIFTDSFTKNTDFASPDENSIVIEGTRSYDDLALSFVDDKYVIVPISGTDRDDPALAWSKASTDDPINAEFHSRINSLGMSNWDFDYGKGLAITKSMGANMSMPVYIKDSNNDTNDKYDLQVFMRYFRNQKGGTINVYFDGKLMKEVDTYDQISNKFEWKKIGALKAEKAKHTLTLQNVAGFNAVNILAILPNHELEKITSKAEMFSNNAQIINIMEGESNFYNDKGNYTGASQYLSGNNDTNVTSTDGKAATILKGKFKVPRNANFANIEYIVNKNNSAQNSSATLDLFITPSENKDTLFRNEFERNRNASAPLASIRQHEWINYDKDLVSTSLDKTNLLEGNYSLGANIKPSTKAGWNILSTDFIPIYGDRYYNTSLSISAKDILQLHSRVLYFDSQKESLEGSADYVFRGKDGTFRNNFSSSILPPLSAKYLKLQILSLSENPKPSLYLLDNVKLEEITMPNSVYHNKYAINAGIENNTRSETRIIRENSTHYVLETQPFTVKEGNTYNYNLDTANMQIPPTVLVVFKNSNDVTQSPKYGNNASQGQVLSLSPESEVEGTFNVMKPSNYTLALRTKTCETCTYLILDVLDDKNKLVQSNNLTLNNQKAGLNWVFTNNFYLNAEKYTIKIYSKSQTDLDSIVAFSPNPNQLDIPGLKHVNQKLDLYGESTTSKAYISGYKKVDSTKHVVDIKNATAPYLLAFAESYDPHWAAHTETDDTNALGDKDDLRTNSIPLYGVTNGFYINKTGNYRLVIEYEPQKWFMQGTIISTISVIVLLIFIVLILKLKKVAKLYRRIVTRIK